jgi:hypothetical protein
MELGVQAGVDVNGLVPSPPPEANEPKKNADLIRHLYRANATYRFPLGNGLKVSGGMLNSFIGYESFLSLENPNYTGGYLSDNVPYFLFGAQIAYPINETTHISLIIAEGWNYLAKSNGRPSYGFQVIWKANSTLTITQNLYYGPEQLVTDNQYWRFFFDSIVAWGTELVLLALAIDGGTEKQAQITGYPRYNWFSGAFWAAFTLGSWRISLRPEFYNDSDGIISGAKQNICAITASIGYDILSQPASHDLVTKLEYRYDRSTGPGGGYYGGTDNHLVPNQGSLFLSLVWRFQ